MLAERYAPLVDRAAFIHNTAPAFGHVRGVVSVARVARWAWHTGPAAVTALSSSPPRAVWMTFANPTSITADWAIHLFTAYTYGTTGLPTGSCIESALRFSPRPEC